MRELPLKAAFGLGALLMAKILIVDDDANLADTLFHWLEFQGHKVETVHDGEEGLFRIKESAFDLIVLDWELPGQIHGVDICRAMRDRKICTPVMMLTSHASVERKETGLDAGADDYLTKPFHLKEFAARMRALLRRPPLQLDPVLDTGKIVLDPNGRTVQVDGQQLSLTPREFSLLELLMRHPNVVFSDSAILERVWPSDTESTIDVVRTHVKTLRRKLNSEDPRRSPIKNVYGGGYKFETERQN